jgi:hypothetical protein
MSQLNHGEPSDLTRSELWRTLEAVGTVLYHTNSKSSTLWAERISSVVYLTLFIFRTSIPRYCSIHLHSSVLANLLQLGILLSPLCRNFLLAELPRLALQHRHALFVRELHLVAHRHQAAGDVVVVLTQQVDGEEHVVDVVEHEGVLVGVLLLLR